MGLANYVDPSDVAIYLPKVPAPQQANWPRLCSIASRGIDGFCDRYFYNDASSIRYFDIDGDPGGSTLIRSFRLFKHDFYGATTIKVAQRENADPAVPLDWVTLAGDGVTPPSDYFLEPANENYVGKTGSTAVKPYDRIELPKTPPLTSTTFQNSFFVGKRTLSIAPANWGWPAIPDQIAYVGVKVVIRMHKATPVGFTGATGSPDTAAGAILRYLDIDDYNVLLSFKKWSVG